jgi:DNA-directed RNA polymerase specialized sigma24 family protein
MDLYLLSQMNIHEIAQIKGVSKDKVDAVVSQVSQELRTRLISMA